MSSRPASRTLPATAWERTRREPATAELPVLGPGAVRAPDGDLQSSPGTPIPDAALPGMAGPAP